jgi:hypothetical protein
VGARVVRETGQWFLAVHLSVPHPVCYRGRTGHGMEGAVVGVKTSLPRCPREKRCPALKLFGGLGGA